MIIPKNKTSYISVKQRYFEENKGGEGLTKEGYTVNRIKRHLFYILMVVSLGSVCVLQFLDRQNTIIQKQKRLSFIRANLSGRKQMEAEK